MENTPPVGSVFLKDPCGKILQSSETRTALHSLLPIKQPWNTKRNDSNGWGVIRDYKVPCPSPRLMCPRQRTRQDCTAYVGSPYPGQVRGLALAFSFAPLCTDPTFRPFLQGSLSHLPVLWDTTGRQCLVRVINISGPRHTTVWWLPHGTEAHNDACSSDITSSSHGPVYTFVHWITLQTMSTLQFVLSVRTLERHSLESGQLWIFIE